MYTINVGWRIKRKPDIFTKKVEMPEKPRKQAKMGRPRLLSRPVRVQVVLPQASVARLNRERERTGESLSAIARRILEGNLP